MHVPLKHYYYNYLIIEHPRAVILVEQHRKYVVEELSHTRLVICRIS